MKRFAILAVMLMVAASCDRQADTDELAPTDFALVLPVEGVANERVQRIELPAAAFVAIQRADKGDVRIFDAHGRPLSIALLDHSASQNLSETYFKAIPFQMQVGATADRAVSVRVDRDGQDVRVETAANPAASGKAFLLDTRKLEGPVAAIALDASVPVQQPVTISLASGADLKTWQPLAEHVLFRPAEDADLLGSGRITLSGENLRGQYLRVSWAGAADVQLTGAKLITTVSPLPQRVTIPTSGLRLTDPHHILLSVTPAMRPSALRITMTGKDGVVPLRLLGRAAAEHPWTPLAIASLKQGDRSALLELQETAVREWSVEADPRSAGFSAVPKLEFEFEPVSLLAAFNGNPPYRLAIGNGSAEPVYFEPSELAKGPGPYPEAKLIGADTAVSINVANADRDTHLAPRVLALWGALILGVVVLTIAAYRLFRANTNNL